MARTKTREEKLFGAAVLKASFALRGQLDAPAFKGVFPGVLRDLGLTDAEVDAYIEQHRETVETAARGAV